MTALLLLEQLMGTQRLSESPDTIRVGGKSYDHMSPNAYAFSIINGKVVSTKRTHPFIFNALNVMANPTGDELSLQMPRASLRREGPVEFLKDYGITVWPSALTPEDLRWFDKKNDQDMGATRENTQSGRVWLKIPFGEDKSVIAAVSFWARSANVPDGSVRLVIDRWSLNDRDVYVEFVDSLKPTVYSPVERTTRKLQSKIKPDLTEKEIMSILVKAHTSPHELSDWERSVVAEFRGEKSVHAMSTGGFATAAERNMRNRIGDSQK